MCYSLGNVNKKKENCDKDARGVNSFLMSAINWPRKNREGQSVELGSYCESILDLLEGCSENSFFPSYNVWRKLMFTSAHASRTESLQHWDLVRRCCRALINHVSQRPPDQSILKLGLESAEILKDSHLAFDMLSWADQRNLDSLSFSDNKSDSNFDVNFISAGDTKRINHPENEHENDSTEENEIKDEPFAINGPNEIISDRNLADLQVPIKMYYRAINLCISQNEIELASQLLSNCSVGRKRIPESTANELSTLVLSGFAKVGDINSAEIMLNQMRTQGLKLR